MLHRLASFVLLATVVPAVQAQGETGFLRGAGNFDLSLNYDYDSYDRFWVGDTKVQVDGVGKITRQAISLYGAYGLSDNLDLVATATYVDVDSDGTANSPNESDLQDGSVYLKWRVLERAAPGGRASLLLSPGLKVPLSNYEDNAVTAMGDGQVDLRARAIGHYHHDSGAWFSVESGYDVRDGDPENEVVLHATLGIPVGQSLTVMPFYSQVWSEGGYDISDVPALGGFPGVQEEFQRAGVRAYWKFGEHWGLSGGWRDTLDGRNTGDVESWSVGLVWRL